MTSIPPISHPFTAARAMAGGGEAGALIRSIDWSVTPVGNPETWPITLKVALRILLDCKLPMYIAWGPKFTQFYNDAYTPILGNKHPAAMGLSVEETWVEIWDTIGPMWQEVMHGKSFGFDNFKLTIERYGYPEDVYFDYSYSPVPDEAGNPAGVLVTFSETTQKVKAEQALQAVNTKLQQALTEQKNIEKALKLKDERMQFALAGAGDGIWDWQLKTDEVFYSDRWKEILGISEEKIENKLETFRNLIHAQDLELFNDQILASRSGTTDLISLDLRMWHKQSKWVWVAIRAKVVKRNSKNEALRIAGTITDVSEFQSLNLEFKRKTELLENLANEIPGVIYQFKMSPDGSFTCPYVSKAVEELFELSVNEVLSDINLVFARVHPEDLPRLMDAILQSASTLDRNDLRIRAILPKKGLRWFETKSKPMRLEDGSILWHTFAADVTDMTT